MIPKRTYTFEHPKGIDLWWAGKKDRPSFTVDTVPLAIFERFSPREILCRVRPEVANKIDAYHHGSTWANRLILGDSLLVMNSLLELEHMSGSVQMVYLDPPYGINYNSKFHVLAPRVENTDENDPNTSKSEKVHAYHDTWAQGIPSYLSHLRDRLLLVKELLHESGSIFVQIGAENAHLVRMLLDEIFGSDNYVDAITVQKTSGFSSKTLSSISDYLLWYSKNKVQMKYRPLFTPKNLEDLNLNLYRFVEEKNGTRRILTKVERANPRSIPTGIRIYRIGDLTSQGATKGSSSQPCEFEGKTYLLGKNAHWKTTQEGLRNLKRKHRIQPTKSNIYYVRFLDDFPVKQLSNIWTDTGQGGFNDPKVYAVQTNTKVVQRCILMTTDPGDLVFDPTCGSGTTAMVAEQWGRRWITCDTSPVATFLARQRLITSVFPSYLLQSPQDGVKGGFQYKSVPHVKLRNLAFDEAPQQELLYDDPLIDPTKMRVPGLINFERLTGVPDFPDNLIANLLPNLQNGGISLPGRESIPLNNLELCKQGPITVTGDLTREHTHKKIALYFSGPYSPLTLGGINDAKTDAGDAFDNIFFMGFHFSPEVQTRIFSERDHHPRLTLISVNFEILLQDLLPNVKGTQTFTIMGQPVIEIKSTGEKNKAYIDLQGIQVFDPKTSQDYTITPEHIAAWLLDEDYDGHAFYFHQCAFLGRKNPWQKAQRGLRGILDDGDFQILRDTQSRPFSCHQGQKIAIKVFDFQGNDASIILTFGESYENRISA
jgi:adenine-specific DNA-methyltransferase